MIVGSCQCRLDPRQAACLIHLGCMPGFASMHDCFHVSSISAASLLSYLHFRLQASSALSPTSLVVLVGSYDRFLNLQIALIIGMQLLMCLFCSIASYIWRERSGKQRYYLGMTEYVQVMTHLAHPLWGWTFTM